MKPESSARGTRYIAVVGPSEAGDTDCSSAEEVGRLLGGQRVVLVCGGLGGVMEAAARGATASGGVVIGLLPGDDRGAANGYLTVAVATGLGEVRNAIVVRAADAVIAVGGAYGTLSEIAFALRTGKPVVGLGTWDLPDVVAASGPAEAVELALALSASSEEP